MTAFQYRVWKFKRVALINARGILSLALIAFLLVYWTSKPPQKLNVEAQVVEVSGKFAEPEIKPTITPTPKPKKVEVKDTREQEIKTYLKYYGSPMQGYAKTFVVQADKYKVDPKLLVALAIIESSGGKNNCAKYNAFSIMQWDKQGRRSCRVYSSYDGSIAYTAWLMGEYKKGGKVTIEQIGARYNPGSKKWIVDIKSVMNKI